MATALPALFPPPLASRHCFAPRCFSFFPQTLIIDQVLHVDLKKKKKKTGIEQSKMPRSAPSLVSLALSSHRGGPAPSSDRATLLYVPFPRLPPPLPIVLTARVCFLRYHRTLPAATPFTISVFCWAWSIKRKVSPQKERGLRPVDQGRNGHATAHRRGGGATGQLFHLWSSSFLPNPHLHCRCVAKTPLESVP